MWFESWKLYLGYEIYISSIVSWLHLDYVLEVWHVPQIGHKVDDSIDQESHLTKWV
jgi:hypothetical protein